MTPSATAPERGRLSDPRNCMCFNLRKASRAITQIYDEVLRPTGLRSTQHSLLRVLEIAGTTSVSKLADLAVMDRTTLARNLELLERERLVRIQPGKDARVREVTLTDTAHKKLAAALPYWEKAQTEVTRKLGVARSERMLTDLFATVSAAQPAG